LLCDAEGKEKSPGIEEDLRRDWRERETWRRLLSREGDELKSFLQQKKKQRYWVLFPGERGERRRSAGKMGRPRGKIFRGPCRIWIAKGGCFSGKGRENGRAGVEKVNFGLT